MAEEEVVTVKIGIDPSAALKESKRFQSELSKRFGLIKKSEEQVNTAIGKYIHATKTTKILGPILAKQAKVYGNIRAAIGETTNAIGDMKKGLMDTERVLGELNKRAAAAGGDEKEEIKQRIRLQRDLAKEKTIAIRAKEKEKEELVKRRDAVRKGMEQVKGGGPNLKLLAAAAREGGETLVKPLSAFMGRDFKSALDEGSDLLGKGLTGAFRKMGKGVKKMSLIPTAGKAGAGGAAVKGIAGMGKALMPVIKVLGKLGPIIGLVSSAIMGLIKLFMDTEAAAKDFHKRILETASTSALLARNMGDADAASAELEQTLKDVREGAMNLSNVQWGISRDTAAQFIAALTNEGVTLERLGDETKRATGYATEHAKVIQMSVAYSRAFGVSLQETTLLQGEMMAEMGMGLDSVQAGFQSITRGAEEAGMASNKFFGMVRSFSADLSLFTLRMADLTKVMGVLGKTMQPRNAMKFMQSVTGKFAGGVLENVRHVMMAGPGKAKGVAQADLGARLEGLSADIANQTGQSAKEIREMIERANPKEIAKWTADHREKVTGGMVEAIQDAANMQQKLAKGGAINTAAILDQLSPMGKIQMAQAESMKMFNGKRLEELSGRQLAAVEATGIATVQEIRGFQKLQLGLMTYQQELLNATEEGIAKGGEFDEKTKLALEKLGVDMTKGDLLEQLKDIFDEDKNMRKTWNALSADQQELLQGGEKQINFQKKIAEHQVSIVDKLGMIVDILMNEIYNTLKGVWDSVLDVWKALPFGDSAEKEKRVREKRFEMQAQGLRDPEVMKAITDAEGNIWEARNKIVATAGQKLLEGVKAAEEEREEIIKKIKTAKGKEEIEALHKQKLLLDEIIWAEDEITKEGVGGTGIYDVAPEEALKRYKKMGALQEKAGIKGATPEAKAEAKAKAKAEITEQPKLKDPPTEGEQKEATKAAKETTKVLKKGVVQGKPTSGYTKAVTSSTLDAIRTGLFEYYMYSQLEGADVAKGLKTGAWTPENIGEKLVKGATEKGVAPTGIAAELLGGGKKKTKVTTAEPKQAGGLVTSIVNGQANVARLPPGEGWTPIGVGERIIPAGGGRAGNVKVELALRGDLSRFITARVVEGAAEFERNKRLR